MGLDVYAVMYDSEEKPIEDSAKWPLSKKAVLAILEEFAQIPVKRGIVCGTANSFRGLCYSEIFDALGHSVYNAASPETVVELHDMLAKRMGEAMSATDAEKEILSFLEVCVKHRFGLDTWY